MSYRNPPTSEEIDRVNELADAIADLLAVQPEAIMTEGALRISLTVNQAERLARMAQASTIIG